MVGALVKRQIDSFNALTFAEAEHALTEVGLIAAQPPDDAPPDDEPPLDE
jgi:hypothetical protein